MISIRRALPEDAYPIYSKMRAADLRECGLYVQKPGNVYDLVVESIRISDVAYVVCYHDVPVILYGVSQSPEDDPRGNVWLMATTAIAKVSKWFLGEARGILEELHDYYPAGLHATVDARNFTHVSWMRHLGFTLSAATAVRGVPFYTATRPHPADSPCVSP